ncbi:hypothetical protein GCM10022241_17690 [Micrococcus endophyticus]
MWATAKPIPSWAVTMRSDVPPPHWTFSTSFLLRVCMGEVLPSVGVGAGNSIPPIPVKVGRGRGAPQPLEGSRFPHESAGEAPVSRT